MIKINLILKYYFNVNEIKKNWKKFFSRVKRILDYENYLILKNKINENENKTKKI